jgi:hypothetical protein
VGWQPCQTEASVVDRNLQIKIFVYVCVYIHKPQAITPKFGMGSSFHTGSAPSQGATTLTNGGVYFENWAWASKQKLLLGVGLYMYKYLWGAHPNPKPAGSLDQSARDYFTMKLSRQRLVANAC